MAELAKSIVSVKSPLAGVVAEVNEALAQRPELVHLDCYGAGWLARLTPVDWARDSRALAVRSLPDREIKKRVRVLLRSVGLEHRADKFPPSLSGGEQQRVAVARALATDPALLLADEPTGNLDADRTVEVMDLLHNANARGTTVVVATHDRSILERYKRRVVLLERGRLVSDGDQVRRASSP